MSTSGSEFEAVFAFYSMREALGSGSMGFGATGLR